MKIWPRILMLLLLGGCATTSLDDLIQQRSACLAEGSCTDELHAEIERKENYLIQREYDRTNRCTDPRRPVEFCDWTMRGCGRSHKSLTDEYACIGRNEFRWIF